jgi:hypothetical protein
MDVFMVTINMKTHWVFPTSQVQRELFKSGILLRQWTENYPNIFDVQDVKIALNQPDYHFYEWLSAVMLWHSIGYLSLVEKYEFKRHKRKQEILMNLISSDLFVLVTDHKKEFGNTQVPDLFVYAPDMSDWFFCEVKGPHDKMSLKQNRFFEALSNTAKKPIYVMKFLEIK